jgi:hypothetical protein
MANWAGLAEAEPYWPWLDGTKEHDPSKEFNIL